MKIAEYPFELSLAYSSDNTLIIINLLLKKMHSSLYAATSLRLRDGFLAACSMILLPS
jgi:hypothetical protein